MNFEFNNEEVSTSFSGGFGIHDVIASVAESASPIFFTHSLSEEELEIADSVNSPLIPVEVYNNLPDFLKECCTPFVRDRERDMFFLTALTNLTGVFNNFYGDYDGRIHYSNLYTFIISNAGAGKGVMVFARMLGAGVHRMQIDKYEVAFHDQSESVKMHNNEIKKGNNLIVLPNAFPKPNRTLLFAPGNISSAAFMKLVQENNGGVVICETEADSLTNSLKQDWGGFSDLLRKGFHHEAFSYSRRTNNEFFEVEIPKISIALGATHNQVSKLIPSSEDGLSSRFIYYMFEAEQEWHDVSPQSKYDFNAHFRSLSERVLSNFVGLKERAIEFTLTNEQWERLNEYGKSNIETYGESVDSSIKRNGLILFRLAMLLTAIRNVEIITDECTTIGCNDVDFESALSIAKVCIKHSYNVHNNLLRNDNRNIDSHKLKFLDSLPAEGSFSRQKAQEIGIDLLKLGTRSIDSILREFVVSNQLSQERKGIYVKC